MTYRKKRSLLAAAGIILLPLLGAAQVLTEAEALRRYDQENAGLKGLAAQVRGVRAEARSWSKLDNPSVAYAQEDAAGTRDEFFLIQQSLPLSGRLGLLRKAGRAAVDSAEAETGYARLLLRSDFRAAFFGLLAAQERAALMESGVRPLREIVRVLGEREKEGESSTFDKLRAERELAETEAALETARILLAEARSRLASFLASGPDAEPLIAKGAFTNDAPLPSLEDLTARAIGARGDYLAERSRVQRFDYERKAAQRLFIPEPVVSAGVKKTTIPGLSDQGYSVSIAIPLPVFNTGGALKARARAAAEQSEAAAAVLRRAAETEVKAAYEALTGYRRIARQYARSLGDRGEKLSSISRLSYEEGEQGILELLDAHRVALNSRIQALELDLAAKLAEVELNRAVGEEVF